MFKKIYQRLKENLNNLRRSFREKSDNNTLLDRILSYQIEHNVKFDMDIKDNLHDISIDNSKECSDDQAIKFEVTKLKQNKSLRKYGSCFSHVYHNPPANKKMDNLFNYVLVVGLRNSKNVFFTNHLKAEHDYNKSNTVILWQYPDEVIKFIYFEKIILCAT